MSDKQSGLKLKRASHTSPPGNSVVQIIVDAENDSAGSGTFVSQRVILTAGHNLLNDDGSFKQHEKLLADLGGFTEDDFGGFSFTEQDVHFFDRENYSPGTKTDIAAIVVNTALSGYALGANPVKHKVYDRYSDNIVTIYGYPGGDGGVSLDTEIEFNKLYKSTGSSRYSEESEDIVVTTCEGLPGMSGGGVFLSNNVIVGETISLAIEDTEISSTEIRPITKDVSEWLQNIISDNLMNGLVVIGENRMYFENDKLLKNTTKMLDGMLVTIDKNGVITKFVKVQRGSLTVNYVDYEGNNIASSKLIISDENINTPYNYNPPKISGFNYVGPAEYSDPLYGTLKEGNNEITLIYEKVVNKSSLVANVTINYVDQEGNQLSTPSLLPLGTGTHTLQAKVIEGYVTDTPSVSVYVEGQPKLVTIVYYKTEIDEDDFEEEDIDDIDNIEVEEVDVGVTYETETSELATRTEFDLPNVTLTVEELKAPEPKDLSVVGSFSKESDFFTTKEIQDWKNAEPPKTLYQQLVPEKKFEDHLDVKIDPTVLQDIKQQLMKVDIRYGVMFDEVKTQKDLLQWFVNFRWRRFNFLDRYIPFTMYADLTTSVLSLITVANDFPILITGNTVLKDDPQRRAFEPFYYDYKSTAVVTTNDLYMGTLYAELGEKTERSLNKLNMSVYRHGADWLITNNKNWLTFSSVNDIVKKISVKYRIDNVTGVHYVDDYAIIYLLSNYTEHALIIDNDFNVVEDTLTRTFNREIIELMDPKTLIFRDRYQYYVNNEDGSFATFPLEDMFDINNNLIKKYTIVQTTLKDPRPVSIVENGPRINTKYNHCVYQLMWSFNDSISIMNMYPAMAYEFDKYSFYNPRKYLTDADYNEACIPMHGGFRRTRLYPWFWGRPGFTWVSGHYYRNYWDTWNRWWWYYW